MNNIPANGLKTKTCNKCLVTQSVDCFSKNKRYKDGLNYHCKSCASIYFRKYYETNIDKLREDSRNYRAANLEIMQEKLRSYQKANREKAKQYSRNYRAINAEKVKESQRRYAKAHPELSRIYRSNRRARQHANGVYEIYTKELMKLYKSSCIYCGSKQEIQADHVIPISRGGRHSIGNLVPACRNCNARKHNKLIVEWKYKK
jgi:5-methylcytosine-specific restriction endonuclease McrA